MTAIEKKTFCRVPKMAPGSVHFPALFSQSRQRTRRSTDARDDPSEFETIGEKGENARGMRDRHTPKKNLLPELTVALNVSFSPSLSPSLVLCTLSPHPNPKQTTQIITSFFSLLAAAAAVSLDAAAEPLCSGRAPLPPAAAAPLSRRPRRSFCRSSPSAPRPSDASPPSRPQRPRREAVGPRRSPPR